MKRLTIALIYSAICLLLGILELLGIISFYIGTLSAFDITITVWIVGTFLIFTVPTNAGIDPDAHGDGGPNSHRVA